MRTAFHLLISFLFTIVLHTHPSTSLAPSNQTPPHNPSRRSVIKTGSTVTVSTFSSLLLPPQNAVAAPAATLALKSDYALPQIGFGLYKTAKEEVVEAASLALKAGVRYFDTAQSYGTEAELGSALKDMERRKFFVSTKIATQQNGGYVRSALKKSLRNLQMSYVDVAFIHSPIGGFDKRLITFSALRALQEEGFTRSVGVANYGLKHLKEIEKEGLELPDVVALEISPYNQHRDVVDYCNSKKIKIVCESWSKLSGKFNWGSDENFRAINEISTSHSITKAQLLTMWAVQSGFIALPRSGVKSEVERKAIDENFNVPSEKLTDEEMNILNGFERNLPTGALGRTDGWTADDIKGENWDITTAI
ncbi:hypothetical protein TrVE_jg11664 [Triparma verrucosa]|uniref:NADP-dependent oxidoreductase domain-containing protein n=1 Tax=Triparma verrucosa TaxID=1606542 RepID=A0A9W6Z9M5_9STRA|nr:hypothetical protein TrVE_jg11664 [Triparma verrucosa]